MEPPTRRNWGRSPRFLKRHIVCSSDHELVRRLQELSIVQYNFSSFDEMEQFPDCKYVFDVDGALYSLDRRIESLNIVGDMLWLKPEVMREWQAPISRFAWLNIAADTFLMRYVSLLDCMLLVTNEVFETLLAPQNCSLKNLKKAGIPNSLLTALQSMGSTQDELRVERNIRFHRGEERQLSSDDSTFKMAAIFEHRGQQISGTDENGHVISVNRYFKEGLVALQREFNSATKKTDSDLSKVYEYLSEEFEARFRPKFRDPSLSFNAARERGEYT